MLPVLVSRFPSAFYMIVRNEARVYDMQNDFVNTIAMNLSQFDPGNLNAIHICVLRNDMNFPYDARAK